MLPVVSIGALLVIGGFLWTAHTAIFRGELSQPHAATEDAGVTLEPERRGLRFLGLRANWPGIAMMGVGALMLLLGAAL
jgi:hypothetical protein